MSGKATAKNPLKFVKQVYDTIHGSIGLTEIELKVIDTPIFQRLHRVMQLGPAYYVYPGATHSRFAHSLGAMHVMNQYLENVTVEGQSIVDPTSQDEWQRMRLAALLHDVGHYPFSHALEEPIVHEFNLHKHDEQSKRIIGTFLQERLKTYSAQEIIDIIGKKKVDKQATIKSLLISSEFDVDKVDYLQRDSYHTGVAYGSVDVDRLLRTMEFSKDGTIIFNKPGPVIENFLLGRYHMYQAIYFHKTVTAFELMIERIYSLLVKEGKMDQPSELLGSDDEIKLSNFDDYSIWQKMFESYRENKESTLGKFIGALIRRDPIRLAVHEISSAAKGSFPEGHTRISAMKEEFGQSRKKLLEEIRKYTNDFDENEIFFFTLPTPISILPDDAEIEIIREESRTPLKDDKSLIFKYIGEHDLYDARIYANAKLRPVTHAAYQKLFKAKN